MMHAALDMILYCAQWIIHAGLFVYLMALFRRWYGHTSASLVIGYAALSSAVVALVAGWVLATVLPAFLGLPGIWPVWPTVMWLIAAGAGLVSLVFEDDRRAVLPLVAGCVGMAVGLAVWLGLVRAL